MASVLKLSYENEILDSTVPKNPIYVFPEIKLDGLVPNSYVQVSVSHLYIPRIAH
jgi:hypothetical protein